MNIVTKDVGDVGTMVEKAPENIKRYETTELHMI